MTEVNTHINVSIKKAVPQLKLLCVRSICHNIKCGADILKLKLPFCVKTDLIINFNDQFFNINRELDGTVLLYLFEILDTSCHTLFTKKYNVAIDYNMEDQNSFLEFVQDEIEFEAVWAWEGYKILWV